MSDVTRILSEIERGDPQASGQLLMLVYSELRKLAAQKLALAATVGTLSLALRKAGEATPTSTRRITLSDLPKANVSDDRFSTISVVRGGQRFEYSVPTEGDGRAVVSAGAR